MKFILSLALSLITLVAHAQNKDQKCTSLLLSMQDDAPITGAIITSMKTGATVVSVFTGSFSISCTMDDSLFITHQGFSGLHIAIGVNNQLPAIIRLQPLGKQLQDVEVNSVNTGYESLPKERATGSFEKINSKLFNQQVSYTVLQRLETIANALYFDKKTNPATTRILIRGVSSIQGPTTPLIILDDFPYEGDLNNINPNDVESVTLLKDAAASSIWGARAGNGVIVITTKKAKAGQPLRIELSSNITIGQKPDLFYYSNISPSDLIDNEIFLFGKGFYNSQISSTSKPPLSPVVELLVKKANGSMPAAEADSKINALRSIDARNEFDRYMYKTTVNTQHALTLSTAGTNSSHFFSAGYDANNGSLDEKQNRITIHDLSNFTLNKILQFTAGITYTRTTNTAGRIGFNNISSSPGNLPLYTKLVDDAGNPLPVTMSYRTPYVDTVGGGRLLDWHYYAADDHNHISNKTILQSFIGNAAISVNIIKGLNAGIKYQYENQVSDNSTEYEIGSFFARNLINLYSQLNYGTGVVTYKVPRAGILSNNSSRLAAHNIRGQFSYTRQLKMHQVNAIAGAELRQLTSTGSTSRIYGYNHDILSFTPMDFVNLYPTFVTGSNAVIPNDQSLSGRLNRYISFYSNAAYTYRYRYSLSVSARSDASNLFGVRTNDKWSPLWSAGLAWDIFKESFYRIKQVSVFRLRITYGYSGNADPTKSGYSVMSYSSASPYTLMPSASLTQFTNPDLRWEKLATLNLGVDFKAFSNRLQGSVEYYHKNGKDLLGFTPVDYTTVPAFRLTKNVASMKANGWDITLNSVNILAPFVWESGLNFNYNKDWVTDYLITNRSAINNLSGGLSISAIVGQPVYGIYVYPWAGLDPQTGDPMGWLNGKPSKDYNTLTGSAWPIDSLKYAGPSMPRVFGSLGNSVSYKGLTLSVRISFKMGYFFLRNSINYFNLFGSRQGHGDYALRWQKPGDEQFTSVPSLVYPAVSKRDQFYNNAEILVEKADHIRLQYITLDYDIKKAFRKLPVANLNFFININNLGLIWSANKYGIDPDYRDNTILPSKNYAIGLRVTF